ncbi:MAG: hypothetical protein O2840_03880, partial [bacterium]|nr:hypothetical protein [bacterium]
VAMSFGRLQKNLLIQLDTNIYVTNKRLAILDGNKLTTVWFTDLMTFKLVPSTLIESFMVLGKYDSLVFSYQSKDGIKSIRYWCSTRVIGGAASPKNETTKALFDVITSLR